jgi:hypothetical protein
MYRFGDGTPFPVQENFIETLLSAIDACVGTFAAAAEIDERREKTRVARKEAEEELRKIGLLEKALETAVAPAKPSIDRLSSPSQQAAARALAAGRTAISQSRAGVEAKLQQLEGEPRLDKGLERMRGAMAQFFESQQLPDTMWRWTWHWNGARASGEAIAMSGKFRASFELAVQSPWNVVPRVGALAPGLEAPVLKKGLVGGLKKTRILLDRCGITAVERSPDRHVMVLRANAAKPSPGWRITVRDPERSGVTLIPVDITGRAGGDELSFDDVEAAPFLQLWEAVDDALVEMVEDRRSLRDLSIGDTTLESVIDPGMVGRAMLGVLGPLVRQIRMRSRVPGELAIKRDIGDGRREELYVPRDQVERRFAMLPQLYRRPFEDIGLGRQATAELISTDDAQTMPESPPRAHAQPPKPPPARPLSALGKLPSVPPTLPRMPPLRADTDQDEQSAA